VAVILRIFLESTDQIYIVHFKHRLKGKIFVSVIRPWIRASGSQSTRSLACCVRRRC